MAAILADPGTHRPATQGALLCDLLQSYVSAGKEQEHIGSARSQGSHTTKLIVLC
jgi:hypothetical protein